MPKLKGTRSHSLGDKWKRTIGILEIDVTADGTGGITGYMPERGEIVDVIVQARATNSGGTATVSDGTTDITDAITMASDTDVTRAGSIDSAASVLDEDAAVVVTTNGAADRGKVTVLYIPR